MSNIEDISIEEIKKTIDTKRNKKIVSPETLANLAEGRKKRAEKIKEKVPMNNIIVLKEPIKEIIIEPIKEILREIPKNDNDYKRLIELMMEQNKKIDELYSKNIKQKREPKLKRVNRVLDLSSINDKEINKILEVKNDIQNEVKDDKLQAFLKAFRR